MFVLACITVLLTLATCTLYAVNGRKYLLIDDLIYMYAVNGMQEVHYLALGKHPIYIVYGLMHEPLNQSIIANRRLGVTRVVFVRGQLSCPCCIRVDMYVSFSYVFATTFSITW